VGVKLISWRLALKYPHRVRALILVDAAGYPHESPAIFKLLRVPLLGEMLAGINAKSIVRKNLHEVFYNDDLVTEAVVDNYYYRLLKAGNRKTVLARARMKGRKRWRGWCGSFGGRFAPPLKIIFFVFLKRFL